MKKALLLTFALPLALGTAYAAPATLPSVSVSGVTVTSPVLRSTATATPPDIQVAATVASAFDTNSSTSSNPSYTSCNNGNNYCGTNDSSVKSKKVVITTDVTVSGQTTTASASDPYSSAALSEIGTSTTYSGSLATPTTANTSVVDGTTTVTVAANVSETVTTCTTTATSYWTGANGSGTQVGTTTTVGPTCDGGVTKTGSGSNTAASYVLDIYPPILTLKPDQSQPTVLQGEDKNIHNVLIAGSAGTPYTLTDTVTSADQSYTNSANGSGTFGPGKDGIASDDHDLVAVHIACDAPIGTYTANAVAHTVDLGGFGGVPFDPLSSQDYTDNKGNDSGGAIDTFQVLPGIALEDQTQVVSELVPGSPPEYAPMTCFSSTTAKNGKVTTFPGSLHITATVNTIGPCIGVDNISGTVITLTLPVGFKFDVTGASPHAHVFIGPAASGFDFHYPQTLSEVTSLIPNPVISGQSVTVDLSNLDLGLGAGVIPASDTIYVRAHSVFSGTSAPGDNTQYVFTTSATSKLAGDTEPTIASSSQTVTALSACVNGN